jgi:apolipoprotein N-acyltransferase
VGGQAFYALKIREPDGALRVAAMGWLDKDLPRGRQTPPSEVLKTYHPLLLKAVRREARLVVSPETGFRLAGEAKKRTLAELSALARRHRVTLAVGYFDRDRNDNRIAFFGPDGKPLGEYVKTHLIPMIERYKAGAGEPVHFLGPSMRPVEGARPRRVRVGGMICQDDNFTELSRRYGALRVEVMVVPTNDWAQVRNYHLENSIFRAVESRYAVVRGASNGISAIIDPSGRVLARTDHFHDGPQVIVTDVPIDSTGPTVYSRWGDWIAILALLGLVAAFPALRRCRRPAGT